jgi:hypothetical protein
MEGTMGSRRPFEGAKKIVVTFQRREDGGLRAYSEALPGFVLSNADTRAVLADIVPALTFMLSEMYGAPVAVEPLTDIADKLADAGLIERLPELEPVQREYVALSRAA